jgi:hypothetical protein
VQLEQTCAMLGVSLSHSRPYIPQGRGKIERWFRTVRDQFLSISLPVGSDLAKLNERFEVWREEYQRKSHSSTGEAPRDRYFSNMQCNRPAPKGLADYFRRIEKRRVKKDRSFRLVGRMYEAPVALIDRSIECRFHEENPAAVEIFYDGLSFGNATLLDPHLNAKLGRNWMTKEKSVAVDLQIAPPPPKTGQLPLGGGRDE